MSDSALAVSGLTKRYNDFCLRDISFAVPKGTIVGLIGENGAGKSTILNAILGLIRKDGGTVFIEGKQEKEMDFITRNHIGVVFDGINYPPAYTPSKLNRLLKNIYTQWDEKLFFSTLNDFSLPVNRKIKTFSKGMNMKLSIAAALSHHSKLLILDEATSGLDPIFRDDVLDILLEYVQDEENSILFSSHITSDLEKIADHIVFVHNGRLVFSKPKDDLINNYGIIKCGAAQFEELDKAEILSYREKDYRWEVLTADRAAAQKKYPKAIIDAVSIDEIMLQYIKGNRP